MGDAYSGSDIMFHFQQLDLGLGETNRKIEVVGT